MKVPSLTLTNPVHAVLDRGPGPGDRHSEDGFGQAASARIRVAVLRHRAESAQGSLRGVGFTCTDCRGGRDEWLGGTQVGPTGDLGSGPIRSPEQNTRYGKCPHECGARPLPIHQIGGESQTGRAVALIEVPTGCGSLRLPGQTRPVAIETSPRGAAQQGVTTPGAVPARFQKALSPISPGTRPGRVLAENGASQSGRNLGADAGADDHLAAGGRQLLQHLCLDHVVEHVVEFDEHVRDADVRQEPNRDIDAERPTLGLEAQGFDRRRVRTSPGSRKEFTDFVLVQAQRIRTDVGELAGSPQPSNIERRRACAGDDDSQCGGLAQEGGELTSERPTRPARVVVQHEQPPAPAVLQRAGQTTDPSPPDSTGSRGCGNGGNRANAQVLQTGPQPAPEELPVLGSSPGVESTCVQPQHTVHGVVSRCPAGHPEGLAVPGGSLDDPHHPAVGCFEFPLQPRPGDHPVAQLR